MYSDIYRELTDMQRRLGHFLVQNSNYFYYVKDMFNRFLKVLFQTYPCASCGQHDATRGFLCVYCQLDDRLHQGSLRSSHPILPNAKLFQ